MVRRKKSRPKKSKREATIEEQMVTMATVEEDEGAVVMTRPKKKLSPDQALEKFALATVAKKIDGLRAEFATLKTFVPKITSRAAFDRNMNCNRYNNIVCYDHTRVVLKFNVPPDNDYIHANYVRTSLCNLPNNFICTQGPMDSTVNDFWRLVWQEKPKTIVMLCKVMESGKQKCSQYFPLNQGETKKYGMITVKNVRKTSSPSEKVFESIEMNVSITGNTAVVLTLFKWLDWPGKRIILDFGVPTSGMGMLRILRQIRDQPHSTAIIHCSAGVGRTGTIVACEICLKILLEGKDLNVLEVIKEMRGQRAGAVQTEGQYVYLHRTLCEYINAKKIAKDKIAEFFTAYLAYASSCKGE